jgi:iron complex outermembrane recepter protein
MTSPPARFWGCGGCYRRFWNQAHNILRIRGSKLLAHTVLHLPIFSNQIRAGGFVVRVILLSIALALCATVLPVSAQAVAQHYQLRIPRQQLDTALKEFAHQTGLQIARFSDTIDGRVMVGPIAGEFSIEQALNSLLTPSGLTYKIVNDQTIAVLQISAPIGAVNPSTAPDALNTSGIAEIGADTDKDSANKSSADRLRLAEGDQRTSSSYRSVGEQDDQPPQRPSGSAEGKLEEIVVTAEKKAENLQDVPIPVSVISGDTLVASNQVKLADYYTEVPGLSVMPSTMSTQTLSIRGVTTGAEGAGPPGAAPTVGIIVDDVPFGGSGGGDTFVPDFDPGDLARVEVLRGPQGTLYGANSMGGLIKYVTVNPSTDSVSGRVEAGTSSVYNGAELGYTFRGSVNLPLGSDFAVRASAFTRQDPGYIDNPVLHIEGINEDHASGGHIAALWQPSDTFSVKLSALYQDINGNGTSDVTPNPPAIFGLPPLGDLQQYYIRDVGPYERKAQAYSAVLTDRIGSVELTALTGYNAYSLHDEIDYTSYLGPLTQMFFGVIDSPLFVSVRTDRITQELRVTAPLGSNVDLLAGGFYSREIESLQVNLLASNPGSGAIVGHWLTLNDPNTLTEYAAFTDLTFHVTDQFDVQVGGRESRFDVVNNASTNYGIYYTVLLGEPSETNHLPEVSTNQNAFTYLLTPTFKISPDLMVYARLASGYRAGGNNYGPGLPPEYSPDKTKNYEVGGKGDFLEHRLSFDASIYYIDWKNIQLSLIDPTNGFSYVGNGSGARSQGVELSVKARPVTSFTISSWVAWNDAKLTQSIPGAGQNGVVFGFAGDTLPNSPRFSGNFALKQEFPLGEATGFVGAAASYVGEREDVFPNVTPQRQYLPAYTKLDLSAGTNYKAWTVNFYVNNVTDKRGLISGGLGNVIPYSFYYIQPRTSGLSVSKSF